MRSQYQQHQLDQALLKAIVAGDLKEVKELILDKHADKNAYDRSNGRTALMLAAQEGKVDIVRTLLNLRVGINNTNELHNKDRMTPLMYATESCRVEVVRLLLDRGADVNMTNWEGVTSLMMAARFGNADIVRMLLDKGADINAKNRSGSTVLFNAVISGNP